MVPNFFNKPGPARASRAEIFYVLQEIPKKLWKPKECFRNFLNQLPLQANQVKKSPWYANLSMGTPTKSET
ncbi:unnamed protein product [Caenorhabditis brenneri]